MGGKTPSTEPRPRSSEAPSTGWIIGTGALLVTLGVIAITLLSSGGSPPERATSGSLARSEDATAARLAGAPLGAGQPELPALPADAGDESAPLPKPSLFVASHGSDGARCVLDAPCRSLDRAYRVAEPGAVVEIADGRYPEQNLKFDMHKTSAEDVTFVPAPDASPRIGGIRSGEGSADGGARHITFKGLTIAGFLVHRSQDLTFEDVTIDGGFWIDGSSDVTIRGGSAGGTEGVHSDIKEISDPCCGVVVPERILIDGVRFHDMVMATPQDHTECVQITGARDVTIRNSRFHRCDIMDINAGDGATPLDGMLIENNVFERSTSRFGESFYSLSVRSGTNVVIRHNSSPQAWIGPDPGSPADQWLVANNLMPGAGDFRCHDAITYSHNLWTDGTRCGPTDVRGKAEAAIDAADPKYSPATDISGRPRPQGAGPDIGALER